MYPDSNVLPSHENNVQVYQDSNAMMCPDNNAPVFQNNRKSKSVTPFHDNNVTQCHDNNVQQFQGKSHESTSTILFYIRFTFYKISYLLHMK